MSEETIKRILRNSGFTSNEADVYILLAKQGALSRSEVSRSLKKDKAQISRILKKLQSKGVMESTLEFPRRFIVIPFEKIIDSSIRTKSEEVRFIETAKKDLLKYLEKSRNARSELPLEKFVVIEGNQKLHSKIADMIRETRAHLSVTTTISSLVLSNKFNLLDFHFNNESKFNVQFRFLSELSSKELSAAKALLKQTPRADLKIRVRNTNFGLRLFPRMVIRDDEEILLFIKSRTASGSEGQAEVSLWTNCKSIVNSFSSIFDELWKNGTDLQTKIIEIERGKLKPSASTGPKAKRIRELYEKTLRSAKKEIIMIISSRSLTKLSQNSSLVDEWAKLGIPVKIMAPITTDNFEPAEHLSKLFRVRHITVSQLETVIVDGKHLFQFRTSPSDEKGLEEDSSITNAFHNNDLDYISKIKIMLDDIWRNSFSPSYNKLDAINKSRKTEMNSFSQDYYTLSRPNSPYKKMIIPFTEKPRIITEKEVLIKINNAKKHQVKNMLTDKAVFYGSRAAVIIHPPDYLNLPEMIISVSNWNEKSSYGAENWLTIHLSLDTQNGAVFVPVALVKNKPKGLDFLRMLYVDTPASKNVQIFEQGELHARVYENVLFAGWTKSIPLFPSKYTLPPSCMLFEGYGKVKPGVINSGFKHGRKQTWEYNGLEAFVTYFHPSMRYSGPGIDGTLSREVILTSYPAT